MVEYSSEHFISDACNILFASVTDHRFDWQQEKLPPGATIVSVILSLDKTRLTHFQGDKQAWPVYLTLGNIEKET